MILELNLSKYRFCFQLRGGGFEIAIWVFIIVIAHELIFGGVRTFKKIIKLKFYQFFVKMTKIGTILTILDKKM